MSKWTYIVYKKSGIQKDILAIQCQMLNLCNDTKPSNHLSSRFDLYLKCKSCHTYNPTKHSFNGPHIKLFLSDTMKKSLNQLPKKFFFFFSYRQKKITLHFIYTNLNIWIISQLKIWKYLAKYFLNIYFNAIAISSNEYRNLKNSDL